MTVVSTKKVRIEMEERQAVSLLNILTAIDEFERDMIDPSLEDISLELIDYLDYAEISDLSDILTAIQSRQPCATS